MPSPYPTNGVTLVVVSWSIPAMSAAWSRYVPAATGPSYPSARLCAIDTQSAATQPRVTK